MNRTFYTVLIAAVVLILAVAAFMRLGGTDAPAPDTTTIEDVPGATTTDPSDDGGGIAPEGAADSDTPSTSGYTMAEVATHASAQSCWTVIAGSVYDLTTWIARHPGGSRAILSICGTDGTAAFTRQHGSSANAQATLASFRIGAVAQ